MVAHVASRNRRSARYPFVAKVTMKNLSSGSVLEGMTSDLSEGGCGVRVFELFRTGSRIVVEIATSRTSLVTTATVAYSLPPGAMGLTFVDLSVDQKRILSGWLNDAVPTCRRDSTP